MKIKITIKIKIKIKIEIKIKIKFTITHSIKQQPCLRSRRISELSCKNAASTARCGGNSPLCCLHEGL